MDITRKITAVHTYLLNITGQGGYAFLNFDVNDDVLCVIFHFMFQQSIIISQKNVLDT